MVFVSKAPSNKFHFYVLLFLSQNVWFFFFRLICWLERMHHACVSKDKWVYEWRLKAFSQLRVVKKVWLFIALSFTFWKMKEPRKFAPWNLRGSGTSLFSSSSFQMLKSGTPLAQRKRRRKIKIGPPDPKRKKKFFLLAIYFYF